MTDEYQDLLRGLQCREGFLRQFRTWADVLAYMRAGTSRDPGKDDVLRPILQVHGDDRDPRWRQILLVFFWPGLCAIHRRKQGWERDPEKRWQDVVWTFLQVLCRIDVSRRPDRLVQKVVNDTIHNLYEAYRREWSRASREIATSDEDVDELAKGEGVDLTGIDLRRAQEWEVRRLREHLDSGRINEADFLLIVGTHVYGQSTRDYARQAGLDYEVAKKRRQRAWAAISKGQTERLSPSARLRPPLS